MKLLSLSSKPPFSILLCDTWLELNKSHFALLAGTLARSSNKDARGLEEERGLALSCWLPSLLLVPVRSLGNTSHSDKEQFISHSRSWNQFATSLSLIEPALSHSFMEPTMASSCFLLKGMGLRSKRIKMNSETDSITNPGISLPQRVSPPLWPFLKTFKF